ncbi:transposase [Streptomyces albofaciens]|uniref:transposase n=1 Tax=Streptomyces albofaciens TaxID=66866 RepID=UPI003CC73BDE
MTDTGYGVMRLAWVLRDLPVEVVGRLRSDRVLRLPTPPRAYDPKGGRPPKHGAKFRLAEAGEMAGAGSSDEQAAGARSEAGEDG